MFLLPKVWTCVYKYDLPFEVKILVFPKNRIAGGYILVLKPFSNSNLEIVITEALERWSIGKPFTGNNDFLRKILLKNYTPYSR